MYSIAGLIMVTFHSDLQQTFSDNTCGRGNHEIYLQLAVKKVKYAGSFGLKLGGIHLLSKTFNII